MLPCSSCKQHKWPHCGKFPCLETWMDHKILGFGNDKIVLYVKIKFYVAYRNTESQSRANLVAIFRPNDKSETFIAELYKYSRSIGPVALISTSEFNILARKMYLENEQRVKLTLSSNEFIFVPK